MMLELEKIMFKKFNRLTAVIALMLFIVFLSFNQVRKANQKAVPKSSWWEVQSIDTMKYSRDPAKDKVDDSSFDKEIVTEVLNIAKTGVTHVAIATPYDEEFLPFLKKWVREARRNNLKVWFRGNFSSWEGWFGYQKQMTFGDHTKLSVEFIRKHPELFEDGDSFTACPECENGAQGDPRQTGKVKEYREFLIKETTETADAFKSINKKVSTNWLSMNGDVANLVMDKETVQKVGGLISVDHYVTAPKQLNDDINRWVKERGAKVFLGEFGAPIPDIQGNMNEEQQAKWLDETLQLLSQNENVYGVNYWTSKGGSTQIWNDDNSPRKAVEVLTKYFKPGKVKLTVQDSLGKGLSGANVNLIGQIAKSVNSGDELGVLILGDSKLEIKKAGYETVTLDLKKEEVKEEKDLDVVLEPENPSLIYRVRLWLRSWIK